MTDKILNLILKNPYYKTYYDVMSKKSFKELLDILKNTNMTTNHAINVYKRGLRQNIHNKQILNNINNAEAVYILNYLIEQEATKYE